MLETTDSDGLLNSVTNSSSKITTKTASDTVAAATNNDVDLDTSDNNVAYDQDNMPIPQGIVDIDESNLDKNESIDLDLSMANNPVWLVRLTPQLGELWKEEGFLHGQLLGNIKVSKNKNQVKSENTLQTDKNTKVLLELNNEIPEHRTLDNEYELKLIKNTVENEYAFSEAQFKQFRQRLMYRTQVVEMPNQPKMRFVNKEAMTHEAKWTRKIKNYKKEAQLREMREKDPEWKAKMNESGMGTTYIADENDAAPGQRRFGKFGNNQGFKKFIPYAKTIPKKTQIVGKIVHEGQIIPTKLASNNKLRMLDQRKRLSQMGKRKTINYLKSERVGLMHGRATPNIQTGSTITLSKELAAKRDAAKAEGRAARMERDALMNLLFKLFNEYEYWTFKGLREKTNQPEAYLKECLESIALMERKGTYALKWRLKDEYRKSIDAEKKVAIGEDEDEDENNAEDDKDDDDMDDVEMEDIAAL